MKKKHKVLSLIEVSFARKKRFVDIKDLPEVDKFGFFKQDTSSYTIKVTIRPVRIYH